MNVCAVPRIWHHLMDLVSSQHTTIIITTHYIEEARQAHMVSRAGDALLLCSWCSSLFLLTDIPGPSLSAIFQFLSPPPLPLLLFESPYLHTYLPSYLPLFPCPSTLTPFPLFLFVSAYLYLLPTFLYTLYLPSSLSLSLFINIPHNGTQASKLCYMFIW